MTGDEFRKLRRQLNRTQKELAEDLGVQASTIIQIEKSLMVKKVYVEAINGMLFKKVLTSYCDALADLIKHSSTYKGD